MGDSVAIEVRRHGVFHCSAVAWGPDPKVRLGLRLRPRASVSAMTKTGARFKLWRLLREPANVNSVDSRA